MSYILDALRRADAERERGAVPGIHAQPVPAVSSDPAGRRGGVPVAWVAAGGAALVAAALAWQLMRDRSPAAPGPVAVAPAPAPTAAPAPAVTPPPMPSPTPQRTAPVQAAPAAEPAPIRREAAPARRTPPAAAPDPARTPPQPRPAPRPDAMAAAPPPAMPAAPASPAPRTAAAPAATGRIHKPDELPPDVRGRLPQLSIGGSRFSADPSKRFLIVNGQLLREKEAVTPDVTLEEIRLRGAVLRIGDWRYAISY
jgi:general secretion pathway protein B